ncbi:hypothetical protein Q7P36_004643 [Cladosporium allicinum]
MNSRSDDQTITRRKFRKGTHSCSECRRRKVKCVFSTPDSTTCVVCLRRETHCFSQADSPVSAILDGASPGVEVDHRTPPRALSSAMSDFAVPPYTTSVSYASMPLSHAHTTSLQYDLLGNQPGRTSIPRDSVLTASATSTGQSQHTAAGMTVGSVPTTILQRHASDGSAAFAKVDQQSHAQDVTATLATPTSAPFEVGQPTIGNAQNALPQDAAMPYPPMMPTDASPPFPAPSFDDLIMDTLLHQSNFPPPIEAGIESWNISVFP